MVEIALAAGIVAAFFALFFLSRPLIQDFRSAQPVSAAEFNRLPPAAIILCVRGADPTLPRCLDGLLAQHYPNLQIHIVLDHCNDPAGPWVQAAADQSDMVYLHTLQSPDTQTQRGLKVSAILQAIRSLDADREIMAFVDADAVPQSDWLSCLAAPLLDPKIGATSGMRWYRPTENNMGSLVRAKWNLYAVAIMRFIGMPWGGSLAVRRDVLMQCKVLQRWSRTLCEDSCLGDELRKQGYKVQHVPGVSMINDETTSLTACLRFITRQLVLTRLHADHWGLVAFLGTTIPVMAIVLGTYLLCAIAHWQPRQIAVGAALLEVFHIGVISFEWKIGSLAHKSPASANPSQHSKRKFRPPLIQLYKTQLISIPTTILAFALAAVARRVTWRGVTYEIGEGKSIGMQEYRPYCPSVEGSPAPQNASI